MSAPETRRRKGVSQPIAGEDVPAFPAQTTPETPNWMAERETAHVWGEINKLNQSVGELKAGITGLQSSMDSLRSDVATLKSRLTVATCTFAGVSVASGAIFGALIWLSTQLWDSVLKPGIAHAVAEQVGPIIDKRIKDAAAQNGAQSAPPTAPSRRAP